MSSKSDVFGKRKFPSEARSQFVSGLFLLLTLFVHCFPSQSCEVFREVQGRFTTSGLITDIEPEIE